MKFLNVCISVLILNIVLFFEFMPQTNALSKRRKIKQMKKLAAMGIMMKMHGKKKMLIPIPIPIPLGLLKDLKKGEDKKDKFFRYRKPESNKIAPKIFPITSWPKLGDMNYFSQPRRLNQLKQNFPSVNEFKLKAESCLEQPVIREPIKFIPTTLQTHNDQMILVDNAEIEAIEIQSQPIIEIAKTTDRPEFVEQFKE